MVDTKQFNPLPLLSVKNGLDSSLAKISSELESYFGEGAAGRAYLQEAHDELHRAVGVLQMLSLEGLAVFSKELETVLREMLAQQQVPSAMHRETLRGALLALTQYLDALADGASNTALRLFYSYQELHQLRGLESAFEVDLFFPEFGVELPAEVLAVPLVPTALASVKKARAQYQRALLKWLRQDNPDQSLRTMRATVQVAMACAPQDQHRAFWWIATGLLDCLIHDGLPAELNANKLLARIDLQMKSMVEMKPRDTEYNTTCGMQYLLARSHTVSETVDKIKQTYVLGTYLPDEQPLSYGEISQVLEQLRDLLRAAQETLEQCEKGDGQNSANYIEQMAQMYALSERLDRDTLQFLCKQIHNATTENKVADNVFNLKMKLAMAMLLLGNGIERYQRLDAKFHDQARLISQLLQSNDDSLIAGLTAIHCQLEEQEVLLPLATEMKSNLQQVELILTVFFNDSNKRGELVQLRRLLHQVYGGLYVLSLDVATQLVMPIEQAIERYISGAVPSPSEMHVIAAAVSTLENYVQGVSQGQKPDANSLQAALTNIERDISQLEEGTTHPEVVVPSGVSVREGGEDAELLEVFLEEAHEVLETLHKHLEVCQRNPHSRDSLIIIRRGFHTLKGSGRMVGLTNLGEVAWAVEKALNKFLQDDKPTTNAVLEMIGDAEVLFQHWIEKLRSGATALIDAKALVAAAERIENGVEEIQKTMAKAEAENVEEPDIVIGGVSLSPVLFTIATDEAASIIETLQRQTAELRKQNEPVISYDLVRAAHTLAGVNRSTGFTDISDLAGALELWLQVMMSDSTILDILQLNLLDQSIFALNEMVSSLRSKLEPKARPDLITRLQIKKKKLTEQLSTGGLINAVEQPAEASISSKVETLNDLDLIPLPQIPTIEQESQPDNDEMDLVAYVQRVAQEQASEPLQWQSPENFINDAKVETKPQPSFQETAHAPANTLPDFDMSALEAHAYSQTQADEEQQPATNLGKAEYAFNFDDLGLALDQPSDAPRQDNIPSEIETPNVVVDEKVEHEAFFSPTSYPETQTPAYAIHSDTVEQSKVWTPHKAVEEDELSTSGENKKRAIEDDLDEQLLPIFLEEADELYPQLNIELSNWRGKQEDIDEGLKIARKLQRNLHTLKGSARMAGAMRLGELTHRVEDSLDAAVAAGKHDTVLLDELQSYFDRIGTSLEKLRVGDTSSEATDIVATVASAKKSVGFGQGELTTEERRESAVLRIRSDIVDELVNEAGEISVARSRMEIELNAFKGGLLDLNGSVQGLRKLVREIEIHAEGQMQARTAVSGNSAEKFDPLEFDRFTRFQELTRFMNESVHDVQTVQQTLLKNLDETSAAMSAQAKLNSGLQQSLMSIRMLPFSSTSQRLYRIVRQTGKELGKKVNLELYGTEIELDRGVLEKMTAPFEHLLRNAIVHGLENPKEREQKGKPPIGNIALTLRQEGNEVVFEFKDDGVGLNINKIRQKGIEKGLLQADEMVSDEKIMLLIFETGLSTAAELTEISGRGVGMNVVLSEIKALGGRIEIASEPDKGASFTIYLPLTLAVMKALMVRAGNNLYAIPSVMVEQVQQIKPGKLVELYKNGHAEWQGKTYPVHYLPRLLGDHERAPESKPYNAVLLLHSGEQRMALHLDELLGNKEVVVKNVGAQLARLPGIAGATVQANGQVVLILNPVPMAKLVSQAHKIVEKRVIEEAVRRVPIVMIVDDSLTVRKITTRFLTRIGYEVVTAKDGVDALEKLVDMMPDVMLLDVEMPRMDGFELAKQLRRDARTMKLPIIMITSRTADKHRDYALELGVNQYMGKPYQEDELLAHLTNYAPLLEPATTL